MGRIILLEDDIDISGYSDEDFIEVFVENFRPWIREKHGDEVGRYPMSLLVKKYIQEFDDDYGLETYFSYGNTLSKMVKVGNSLVRKGKKTLPSLRKEFKFIDKFKKTIEHFVSSYNFPDYVKLKLDEDKPFNVNGHLIVDFESAMKSKDNLRDVTSFGSEFKQFIKTYLGFEYGSPAHGNMELYIGPPTFYGIEDWNKNFFNKKFKKEIKEIPGVKYYLHSVKLEPNSNSLVCDITLTFRRHTSWSNENNIREGIEQYLEDLGYNTQRLRVRKK